MRGAEEKTGRQEKSLSEWRFYLRLLLRSIDCFRGQAAVTRHLFWFLLYFFSLFIVFFSFVNVP